MAETSINWHPADIKAAISKRGANVAQVARGADIHETTVPKALRHPCLTGEKAISSFLGVHPKVIWPARYDSRGNPRHARPHLRLNVLDKMQSSQKLCQHEQKRKTARVPDNFWPNRPVRLDRWHCAGRDVVRQPVFSRPSTAGSKRPAFIQTRAERIRPMTMGAIDTVQSELPDWFVDFMGRYAAPSQPSIAQVHAEMRQEPGQETPDLWVLRRELREFERAWPEVALVKHLRVAMVKRDPNTLDMFSDWEPPQIAAQLPPEVVCGGTLPGKIARAVSRRILASSWLLQILEATDAGVELGLSLLGVKPVITQWWQETPKAKPNTHVIEIFADDVVGGAEALFNDRSVAQIWAMINATKRFSQGTKLVLGERFRTAQPVRSSCRVRMREAARHEFQPVISVPAALPIRSSLRIRVVDHARHVLRGRPGPYRLAEGVIA